MMPAPPEFLQRVLAAEADGDLLAAVDLWAGAAALRPGDAAVRLRHAEALGRCGRFAACRKELKSVRAMLPAAARASFPAAAGMVWRRLGRDECAEPLLREAAAAPGAAAEVHEAWVDALERLNRVEEAAAALRAAARRFPGRPALELLAARLRRRRGAWDQAEAAARRCLAAPGLPVPLALEAGHELAHALDGQGRYQEAFAALLAAKEPARAAAGPQMAVWRRRRDFFDSAASLPAAEDFRAWAQPRGDDLPDPAFLLGCPRSGTTLLERILDAHPGVVTASETQVWHAEAWAPHIRALRAAGARPPATEAEAVNLVPPAWVGAGARAYRAGMEAALEATIGGRVLVDKNPSYFSQLPRILRFFPQARLLVALRDPRAVAWSCFAQALPVNAESAAFLDPADTVGYVSVWLRRWLRLRGRLANPWHEVRYERIVRDTAGEAGRALDFLGVPWDQAVLEFHRNPAPIRSPSYAGAARPVHAEALEKWRHYGEFLAPHLEPLRPVMDELGYAW